MATPTVFTPKRLTTASLLPVHASPATIYTATGVTTQLKEVIFANTVTTANTIRFYLIPSGGSLGDASCLIKDFALPTDGTPMMFEFDSLYMNPGDFIQATATNANQVALHLSGNELT